MTKAMVRITTLSVAVGVIAVAAVARAAVIISTPAVLTTFAGGDTLACPVSYNGSQASAAGAAVTINIYNGLGVALVTANCTGPFAAHRQICTAVAPGVANESYTCEVVLTALAPKKVRVALIKADPVTQATQAQVSGTRK